MEVGLNHFDYFREKSADAGQIVQRKLPNEHNHHCAKQAETNRKSQSTHHPRQKVDAYQPAGILNIHHVFRETSPFLFSSIFIYPIPHEE